VCETVASSIVDRPSASFDAETQRRRGPASQSSLYFLCVHCGKGQIVDRLVRGSRFRVTVDPVRITILRAVVLLAPIAMPAAASAQYIPRDSVPNFAIPPLIRGPQSGAIPTIGTIPPMGLPSIGLPLPSIGLPPAPVGVAQPRFVYGESGPGRHQRHSNNWNRGWPGYSTYSGYPGWPVMVVMTPPGFYGVPQVSTDVVPAQVPAPAPKGSLLLHVQPARAQVFVDGYYAGTADDFDGNPGALVLDTGAHIIELDDPSYLSVRFDVRIDTNQSIVYRRELSPISPAITAPPAAPINSTPTPMYLIPGCYLGNVPPKDAGLPSSCDPARVVRLK
jgi:hypothetical protein